jgi:hypothetical protein
MGDYERSWLLRSFDHACELRWKGESGVTIAREIAKIKYADIDPI